MINLAWKNLHFSAKTSVENPTKSCLCEYILGQVLQPNCIWTGSCGTLDFPSSRLFSMLWEVSISSNVTLTNSIPPSAPLYNNQPCIPHHRHPYTPAPITIRVTVSPLSLSLAAHYLVIKPSKLYPLYTRPIFNRPIFTLYSARFQSANFDAANQSIFTIFQWANFKWFWNLNHLICNCV